MVTLLASTTGTSSLHSHVVRLGVSVIYIPELLVLLGEDPIVVGIQLKRAA
jgi:hypothetical protein